MFAIRLILYEIERWLPKLGQQCVGNDVEDERPQTGFELFTHRSSA